MRLKFIRTQLSDTFETRLTSRYRSQGKKPRLQAKILQFRAKLIPKRKKNIRHKNSKIFPYWYSYLSLFGQLWRLLSACMSVGLSVLRNSCSVRLRCICKCYATYAVIKFITSCESLTVAPLEIETIESCLSLYVVLVVVAVAAVAFCWRVHKVQFSLPLATRHRVNKDLCRFFMSYWLLHTNKSQIFSIVGCFCLFL